MRIALLALAMAFLGSVLPVSAQAVIVHYQLNIPAQPLDTALKDFAHQTGLQVARMSDRVDGSAVVGPVKGDLSAEDALKSMLGPRGLSYKMVNERTIAIVRPGDEDSASPSAGNSAGGGPATGSQAQGGDQKKSFWDHFRLAQTTPSLNSGLSSQRSGSSTRLAQADVVQAGPEGNKQQEQSAKLDEIVVTAQKREERLQDVPFSVAAVSQDQIRNASAESIVDLARNVAGLTIADLGPGQSQLAIRGISSGQVIRDQPGLKEQVGVYLDDSPISVALFTPDLELFDLDRFEVLRGPQGTLFGAGSEAGTLRYITTQPKLGVYEGITDTAFEYADQGTVGGNIRTAVNLPAGDSAALRFVGYYHHLPGFIDAIQPDGRKIKGVNDGNRAGFRLAMLWKPTEELSVTPRVIYQNLTTNGFPRADVYNILANPYTTTQPAVTIGEHEQYTQLLEGMDDNFALADLKVDNDFGPATLTSVSTYVDRKLQVTRDSTQLAGSVTFDVFGDVPLVRTNAPLYDRTHLNVLSQELRLASNGAQTIDWLIGGFFQHVGRLYLQDLPYQGIDALNASTGFPLGPNPAGYTDDPAHTHISYVQRQYAGFGEGTWHATNALALTAGLRYYSYHEERLENTSGVFVFNTPPGGAPGSVGSSGVSPRGILSYKVSEDAQFNLQASKGFRLGGINDAGLNANLCSPQDLLEFGNHPTWKDETTKNYEIGTKLRFLDRRVTLNVSAFYIDIANLQATTTAGTCSERVVINVPKARSQGVEAELFARPNSMWDFGLSATWVVARLGSSVVSTLPDGTQVIIGGLADGARLPTAPEVQAVGSVGFTQPIGEKRDFFTLLTVQYVGSSFSQFENEGLNFGVIGSDLPGAARLIGYGDPPAGTAITYNAELPSYSLGNIRAGVRSDRWETALYVNNLWNETAHLALDYERGRSARVGYLINQPRTFGVALLWKY